LTPVSTWTYLGFVKEVLQPSQIAQETSIFAETPLRAEACIDVLTKVLTALTQGETFTESEVIKIFFGCTKLFQSNNIFLRRMVYLVLKELSVASDQALIVTNCLLKDMSSDVQLFRANAVRVLGVILDAQSASNMERFVSQGLVDENAFTVTSTLIAAQRIASKNLDVVKRWSRGLQDAYLRSPNLGKFHALCLNYQIKASDKIGLQKAILDNSTTNKPTDNIFAQCQQIRVVARLLRQDKRANPQLFAYLVDSLRDRNFAVEYEAARAICSLDHISPDVAVPALQEMLRSRHNTIRFAALRTIADTVSRAPMLFVPCEPDLHTLVSSPNRSLASLAITVLLRIGAEETVEKLIKTVGGFLKDVPEDLRVVLIDTVRGLGLRYPHKHEIIMRFFAQSLRHEGSLSYKRDLVSAIVSLAHQIPSCRDAAVDQLAELVEDCEYPEVLVNIVNQLAELAPLTSNPGRCVRLIYNRAVLENAPVRAAAVSALAKLAASVPNLAPSMAVLLQRIATDADDEVRDRALFNLAVIGDPHVPPKFAAAATNSNSAAEIAAAEGLSVEASPLGVYPRLPDLCDLEYSLTSFLAQQQAGAIPADTAFDVTKHLEECPHPIRLASDPQYAANFAASQAGVASSTPTNAGGSASGATASATGVGTSTGGAAGFAAAPVLGPELELPPGVDLGKLWKRSPPVQLTEPESEYVVTLHKHVFETGVVVMQFEIQNNMRTAIERSLVNVNLPNDWVKCLAVPSGNIPSGGTGFSLLGFRMQTSTFFTPPCPCQLVFVMEGEDQEDELQLEYVSILEGDFMKRPVMGCGIIEFKKAWETSGDTNEVIRKCTLSCGSLREALDLVISRICMISCDQQPGQEEIKIPSDAKTLTLNLHGIFFGSQEVLARVGFMLDVEKNQVTFKIAFRSGSKPLSELIAKAIR